MNGAENLLVVAMEECAEIQQELAKVLRFGVNNHHPGNLDITNGERVLKEYFQLKAVMDLIMLKRIINPLPENKQYQIMREKKDAVEKWEEYSKTIGQIN